MKITVIGAGTMGSALVSQRVRAGHQDIYLGHGAGLGAANAPTSIRKV